MEAERRILVLDGWRAVSIGAVVVSHLIYGQIAEDGSFLRHIFVPWLELLGTLGVHIFFVISGFVIFRGLLAEQHRNGSISVGRFYVRRIARIVPPLALYVFTVAALTSRDALKGLTFLCDFRFMACPDLVAHTWTLSIEEQFYIAVPFVAVMGIGRRM